jgi:hypothetical protein
MPLTGYRSMVSWSVLVDRCRSTSTAVDRRRPMSLTGYRSMVSWSVPVDRRRPMLLTGYRSMVSWLVPVDRCRSTSTDAIDRLSIGIRRSINSTRPVDRCRSMAIDAVNRGSISCCSNTLTAALVEKSFKLKLHDNWYLEIWRTLRWSVKQPCFIVFVQ